MVKVSKKSHIRDRYNQAQHLTQDTTRESGKTQDNITYKRPFPAGDHKAAMNRQESITNTKHKQRT